MDGFKRRLKESIRFRLSLGLSLVILAVALVAGGFAFVAAFDEAHELQDDVLRQVAALFDPQHLPAAHVDDRGRSADSDEESRVVVQFLAREGAAAVASRPANGGRLRVPPGLPDGMQTVTLDDEPYRLFLKTLATGDRIAVAQETGVRDEAARSSALRTVMPFVILIPILLAVVADLVRKLLRPISELSAEIDRRSEQQLHPLPPETLPVEVRPFVVAINRLLGRVSRSMDAQRRFVADAAHELRSPLTALSLQAERLAGAEMSQTASERLGTLRRGIDRTRALLDQLLALARAQLESAAPATTASVQTVFCRVLEDLMPLAESRGIDIGIRGDAALEVGASEADLTTMVRNLVDNALRYTPPGGRVDLSAQPLDGNRTAVRVEDSGPGIAPDEQGRVFDAFYRIPGNAAPGSGLGLSIVQTLVQRIGATVELGYVDAQRRCGLRVCIVLPSAAPAVAASHASASAPHRP